MPIHYVGKPGTFKGKPLFHILCNLKNFGINRVVIRNTYLRYPEPTYYRIIRAQPSMDAETAKGTVWMDYVFRGVKCGIGEFSNTDIKDWQLLSKEEELEMCKNQFQRHRE